MTIGIAISGPSAGLAAFQALRAVDSVGRGAIGGFVSLTVVDANGELAFEGAQRGGASGLCGGAGLPRRLAEAPLAALMSSGPDRPEPLSQFAVGDPRAGLLTGHRFPNMPCAGGRSLYEVALDCLDAGASPEEAVAEALALDPTADAGLIAMNVAGDIALGNTEAVAQRDDIGEALTKDEQSGLRIGVLHNSVFPHRALAALAVSAAIDAVAPGDRIDGEASVIGLPLKQGDYRHLVVDDTGKPLAIIVPDEGCFDKHWEGAAVRRGDPVHVNGAAVGYVTYEVYTVAHDGHIVGGRGGERVGWRMDRKARTPRANLEAE
ncbi:DUF6963 family protein [Bauldia sp.]|uniref:DUF6963 family protein n=1 Tax=Bauldia sp. TaxID=2575872 RepID=UPI003BA9D99D